MAPSKDGEKPKDRIDMIVDISKTGKLVEMGCDPFTQAPENKAIATQTEGTGAKAAVPHDAISSQAEKALELILSNKEIVKSTDSPASQVLRLVVGLLGMEAHEQPNPWAESWLTFQDQTFSSLGLGSKKSPRKESDLGKESAPDWQKRVLDHLRKHVESRTALNIATDGSQAKILENGHDWGPDFPEHLNLAEFALGRITYAVSVLEDPEKHERPLLLREYTEEMVLKVAKDLRQWLHQLGTLLGLYHVHLLDLEAERRKLAKLLEAQQAKFAEGEEDRQTAVRRHDLLREQWNEEKMKRDAERLLGLKLLGDDAKIYSQKDVDDMREKWEQEMEGMMIELRELRSAQGDLQDKLRQKGRPAHEPVHHEVAEDVSMGKASVALLVGIIDSANERVFDDPLNRLLSRLAGDVAKGGHNLADILASINALPIVDRTNGDRDLGLTSAVEGDHPAMKCLDSMAAEFDKLEAEARTCPITSGADKLGFFAAWARDATNSVRGSLVDGGSGHVRSIAPPKWDLGILSTNIAHRPAEGSSTGKPSDSGGDAQAIRKEIEDECEKKLRRLKRELEAKLREATEAAERERVNAQEALERLAEESAKADATLAELRRKIQMLEAILREKGLGKQAEDAIWGAGLSEFMQGRDVFERLYRDALDRMRRLAESQARFFEESSTDFLRSIGSLIDPRFRTPGLEEGYDDSETNLGSAGSPPPTAVSLLRYAGSAVPTTASPPRSRSPGSPTNSPSQASKHSPRAVQTAPSRMNDPLSVARLLTPAALAATPIAMKESAMKRTEPSSKLHTGPVAHGLARVQPQRGRECLDVGLSIGSMSSPCLGQDGGMRRPPSQQHPQLASRHRPPPASRGGAGLGDGKMLPPLECKGQGRGDSRSPSNDDMEARLSKLRGVRGGTPLLPKEARLEKERLEKVLLPSSKDFLKDQLLSIGSLRPSGSPPPPSGLLPPHMISPDQRIAAAKGAAGRPATHTGVGRMARQGGNLSMPHLGPPRLLVQSVGAAY